MPFSQLSTSVTIINSGLIGYMGISLTNFDTSAVSAIASGSGIEIAGAFFKASEDITINASSWTAITTATNAYLALTPSGTAGSQILTAAWTATSPTWSTSKQGWYASAASNIRVVAKFYKNSSASYLHKYLLDNPQNIIPNGAFIGGIGSMALLTNFGGILYDGDTVAGSASLGYGYMKPETSTTSSIQTIAWTTTTSVWKALGGCNGGGCLGLFIQIL